MVRAHRSVVRRSSTWSLYALLIWALSSSLAAAQTGPEYSKLERDDREDLLLEERQSGSFTGALAIYGAGYGGGGGPPQSSASSSSENPSGAVQAQCPADHPVSCTNIQQPYYCCPANNVCSWANSVVACCPEGETCSGNVQYGGGGGGGGYQSSSQYIQPSSTWQQPPQTGGGEGNGGGQGGGYVAPAGTTPYNGQQNTGGYNGGYCSTIVEIGPDLPTTAAGQCGTILIAEAEAIQAAVLSWTGLIAMMVGLQVLGGLVFLRR